MQLIKTINTSVLKEECIASNVRNEELIYSGNRILVIHDNNVSEFIDYYENLKVDWNGKNSLIVINEPVSFNRCHIVMGNGAYCYFGCMFRNRHAMNINLNNTDSTLYIDHNANFGNCNIYAGDESQLEVIIGKNFLAAVNLELRASDGHTIFEEGNNKNILNRPKYGIHIADHVWCGMNVIVGKDSSIPKNCVIGAGSLVTKRIFKNNSIIAGVPAKVIKENINWDSRSICNFEKEWQ